MVIALLDVQFFTSRLGNQSLVHKGYQFSVKHFLHSTLFVDMVVNSWDWCSLIPATFLYGLKNIIYWSLVWMIVNMGALQECCQEYLVSRLGNQSLVHKGYQFSVKHRRDNRCYWICITRNCRATLNTQATSG
jgi:HKD family nuclease